MARTRWQRRRAVASTADRLRFAAVLLAVIVVGLDVVPDGIVPVGLVLIAGSYVFVEGCYRASFIIA